MGPADLPPVPPADATDLDAAADAAKGASVVYQCVNAPYTQWPELFPPLQRGVLTAAERTGALLVALENLYGYGPTGGRPMTEDLPLAATGAKGRTRAAMTAELLAAATAGRVRIAIGRASDFFGAGVTQGSTLGEPVFGNALAGRRADFIGNPGLPHSIVRRRAVWTRLMTAQARLRTLPRPGLSSPHCRRHSPRMRRSSTTTTSSTARPFSFSRSPRPRSAPSIRTVASPYSNCSERRGARSHPESRRGGRAAFTSRAGTSGAD
jgi:hypothetical protein